MISSVTNSSALFARLFSIKNTNSSNSAAERLSSGKRINNSGDDAAGNAVSLKMDALIQGQKMAIKTISDGVAGLEIQDSGLAEIQSVVGRLRELAVQMASGIYTDVDRDMGQIEFEALADQIGNLVLSASYNNRKTMNGSSAPGSNRTLTLQAGATAVETIDIEQAAGTYLKNQLKDGSISIDTQSNAKNAVDSLSTTLSQTLKARAINGAAKNRLISVINNLSSSSIIAEGAKSRIVDANMARESIRLGKFEILNKASTAMLTIANSSKSSLLQLVEI